LIVFSHGEKRKGGHLFLEQQGLAIPNPIFIENETNSNMVLEQLSR
jgi:hypothetical protein